MIIRQSQSGATLAITLIILFIITLLGVSTIQVTQLQEKMSANLQDKELSFNAAETALAAGEAWILSLTSQPASNALCTAYPCVISAYQNLDLSSQNASWWAANSTQYSSTLDNVTSPPRYIVEFLQFIPDTPEVGSSAAQTTGTYYYQITSRGTGSTNDSVSILQTTMARRF